MDIYSKIHEIIDKGNPAALCTIIETSGSTPRKPGSKMIVCEDEKTFGSVGGGKLEQIVIKDALKAIARGNSELKSYDSGNADQGQVYGKASIFIDVLPGNRALIIFGAGHVGQAVAEISGKFGFAVSLIDPRTELLDLINIPGIQKLNMPYLEAVEDLPFDKHTYVIVMTNSHQSDEDVTYNCYSKPHAYLGMIGSKKKIEQARENFTVKGMAESEIDDIDMPVGMPMNCETPAEIAISILARLIDRKNA